MKCCTACGRDKPRSEFYLNRHGNQQGKCKACHRVLARESYRRRYRHVASFRLREQRRKRDAYRTRIQEAA